MFEWYRGAQVCYVYLSDVSTAEENPYDDQSHFRKSKWFTRGWTLQELLAPDRVEFYDREWKQIGTKLGFTDLVQSITGISHIVNYAEASVAQKMSWASRRETTRLEDQAYCLLGLFNVYMPLLYGEGPKAFLRLQQEILNKTDDDSIFAWEGHGTGGLLASSPKLFHAAGNIVINNFDPERPPHATTSKGLSLALTLLSPNDFECLHGRKIKPRVLAPINCKRVYADSAWQEEDSMMALVLYRQSESTTWRRERRLLPIPVGRFNGKEHKRTIVYVPQPALSDEKNIGKNTDETQGENITGPDRVIRYRQPVITTIDWRRQLCQFLEMGPESTDDALLEALEDASEKLKKLKRLKETAQLAMKADINLLNEAPIYQVLHRVRCALDRQVQVYLEQPFIVKTFRQGSHLSSINPIHNLNHHLEANKSISFIVYRDYRCCDSQYQQPLDNKSEPPNISTLMIAEAISIVSSDLCSALATLASEALVGMPDPDILEVGKEFSSPPLWWFHNRESINCAKTHLDQAHQDLVLLFEEYLQEAHGATWTTVDYLLSKGKINGQYIEYLYAPNMIIVGKSDDKSMGQQQAYFVNSWLLVNNGMRSLHPGNSRSTDFTNIIEGTSWTFDGNFQKRVEQLNIGYLSSTSMSEAFDITDLNFYPIKYAKAEVEHTLRARGRIFWNCRSKTYVEYSGQVHTDMPRTVTTSRFMVDTATYNLMHPNASKNSSKGQDEIGPDAMSRNEPPQDDKFLLCLPNTIPGYSMNDKSWNTLDVSRIHEVRWNDMAFEQLVLDRSAKELILALVTGRNGSKKDADIISGKKTGLIILLHGPPGTGKTLTAESIAEFSRRPLYRVTAGDIGTSPEEVEKYLETVLTLGKLWDCVILLDEADSFLERRRTFDTERNAVVSVFLRVLDYFDGILILSTNRVGAFDEAFISRVQLSLLFKPFDETQRSLIWEVFLRQLSPDEFRWVGEYNPRGKPDLGNGENRDTGSLQLAELAKVQMNGREIRNAISTAKQLALYRGEQMTYQHIKVVIQQARSFNDYSNSLVWDESFWAKQKY
ncbi:hypothetical protein BGZ60DRAFT_411777 [Tricladium varicosporioides]|nr:hypothetical protein BGZ60DRAFT_411777 [Hymenoscyphus varicosporioides]